MGIIAAILARTGLSDTLVKIFAPILELLLLLFGLYALYWYGGHVEDVKWQAKMTSYKERLQIVAQDGNAQIKAMQMDHQQVVADLKQQLEAARAQAHKTRTIIKEVTKYVDAQADSRCTVPAGFVWLSNVPLGPEVSGLSASPPRDAEAPSGVALSAVAATVSDNYTECVARGEVIKAWQEWYVKTKALWDTTKASMPREPEVPK